MKYNDLKELETLLGSNAYNPQLTPSQRPLKRLPVSELNRMQQELEQASELLSQQLFRQELQSAYDIGLDAILSSQPGDVSGVISLLQLLSTVKQMKLILTREDVLSRQIKEELELRDIEAESK